MGTEDVRQFPCTTPDPLSSCGTHSCQKSSHPQQRQHLPACTTAPLCISNTTAAPGPCSQSCLPLTPTLLCLPYTLQAPTAPGRGHGALTGHSHSRTTLQQRSNASSHPVHNTRVPSWLTRESLSCRPARTRGCSTRVHRPAAVLVLHCECPSHAPAPLRPALPPCLPPALPASSCTATAFGKSPIHSTCAPCRTGRQHLQAGAGRSTLLLPPGWKGDTQHQPGRGCHVCRRAPVHLCVWRARQAGRPLPPPPPAPPPPPPREALPFRTEKGYCMTRDGDASRPAAAPAPSCAARSERPGT